MISRKSVGFKPTICAFMMLSALIACKNDDVYRDNKTLPCRPLEATDGNRCEKWSWEKEKLIRWQIFEGGGCDSVGESLVYEFDYDENGTVVGFKAFGEIPYTCRFEYDDSGRPTRAHNSLGESVQWIYENERIRRAVYSLRDTFFDAEYEYDAYGNVVRSGDETLTYDVRVKNMYLHVPKAALLWVKGPEYASPHQRLIRRNAAGAEFGYKAVVANAQAYPVRLVTLDAGLVTVGYECR